VEQKLGWNLRRWNWLDYVLIPALSAGAWVAWVVPLANAVLSSRFVSPSGVSVPAWLPFLILLGGSALARIVANAPGGRAVAAISGLFVVLAMIAYLLPAPVSKSGDWFAYLWEHVRDWRVAIPAFWPLLLLTGGLWLRAITVDWLATESLRRGFRLGIVVLVLLAVSGGSQYGLNLGIVHGLTEAILIFIICSLSAFALSDISLTMRQALRTDGARIPLGKHWFVVLLIVVSSVLVLGWLLALLLAPDSVLAIATWLRPVLTVLTTFLTYVLMILAYIIFTILNPLIQLLQGMIRPGETEFQPPTQENMAEQLKELEAAAEKGGGLPPWLSVVLLLGLVALILLLFALAVRRRFVSYSDGVLESREVDWSWEMMRDQISDWLSRARPVRRSRFLPLDDSESARARVRSAYRRLLALASERDMGRSRWQTPWRYMRSLASRAPELEQPLAVLTHAYIIARYSPIPPDQQTVQAALNSLKEIESWMYQLELSETTLPS